MRHAGMTIHVTLPFLEEWDTLGVRAAPRIPQKFKGLRDTFSWVNTRLLEAQLLYTLPGEGNEDAKHKLGILDRRSSDHCRATYDRAGDVRTARVEVHEQA